MAFESNSPTPPITTQDYDVRIRLSAEQFVTVRVTARDIFEAKTRAAELHRVTYDDTQLVAIIDHPKGA